MVVVVAVVVVAVLVLVVLVVLVLVGVVLVEVAVPVAVLVGVVLAVVVLDAVVFDGVVLDVVVLVEAVLVVWALVVAVLDAMVLLAWGLVVADLVGVAPVAVAPVEVLVQEVVPVPTAPLRPVASVATGSTMKLGSTRAQLVSARMAVRPGSPPLFSEGLETWTYQGGQAGSVHLAVASWSYESAADPSGKVALVEDSCDSVFLAADCILEKAGSVAPAAAGSGVAGHQSLGNGRVPLGCSGVLAVAVADPIVAPVSLQALSVGSLVSAHLTRKRVAERNPAEVEALVAVRCAG
ncbi:hypothetical protein B0T18DRAFT_388204 [Schizothecium vesticola]|uniref:Uncharacterized protein n=1 Tax=Schizothecium vesticola TaxID=314040 RepID=A0AA40F6S4_9PEZI|nr:hypothetical protein B0T18DRAFT_388204 [Schizothecium vesticola]